MRNSISKCLRKVTVLDGSLHNVVSARCQSVVAKWCEHDLIFAFEYVY